MKEDGPVGDDPFRALRQEYLAGAHARVEGLAAAVAAALHDPSSLEQVRYLAHNLRGSGGFYGYTAISEAAAALEERVLVAQSGAPVADGEIVAAAEALARLVQATRLED